MDTRGFPEARNSPEEPSPQSTFGCTCEISFSVDAELLELLSITKPDLGKDKMSTLDHLITLSAIVNGIASGKKAQVHKVNVRKS